MLAAVFLVSASALGLALLCATRLTRGSFLGVLAASVVVGTVASTWVVFGLSLAFGFRVWTVAAGAAFSCAVVAILLRRLPTLRNLRSFVVRRRVSPGGPLVVVLLVFFPLLGLCVGRSSEGDWLYRGNYEDLSYHAAIASAFLEQASFPPLNPQSAQAPLVYHYLTDFHSAILRLGGFDLFQALVIPNVLFSLALLVLLAEFTSDLLRNKLAAAFAGLLSLGSHIGASNVVFALLGVRSEPVAMANMSTWAGFREVLLFPFLNFLDPVVNLFQPQRPFLLGLPVALFVLRHLRTLSRGEGVRYRDVALTAVVGLLPLVHIHSFLFLAPCACLVVVLRPEARRKALPRLVPLLVALPQLVYLQLQPKAAGFSGWDVHKIGGGLVECAITWSAVLTRLVFWVRAGGLPLILGLFAMVWYFRERRHSGRQAARPEVVAMILVGGAYFVLINFFRFSPNWGDSNKFYFYFQLGLSLCAGELLAQLWRTGGLRRTGAVLLLAICVGPMAIEGAGILQRPQAKLFTSCEVRIAEWIRRSTAPEDVFLSSDHVVHFVPALAGRRVVDGAYTWNTGVQKPGIQDDIARFFRTGDPELLERLHARYVILGWRERSRYPGALAGAGTLSALQRWTCPEGGVDLLSAAKPSGNGNATLIPVGGIYIADLQPLSTTQRLGKPEVDLTFNRTPIVLNGVTFRRGLGVHAPSEVTYRVPVGASVFLAKIGLDDSEDHSPGSVVFRVLVDGSERFVSPTLRWDSPTQSVRVPVGGAGRISLVVEDARDGITCDHGSWAEARFE